MKRLLILLFLFALMFEGCKVQFPSGSPTQKLSRPQRIAQRKLRKAIKWDPDIIKKQYTDTAISGIATAVVKDTFAGFDIETLPFDCDSVQKALKELARNYDSKTQENAQLYIFNDSLASVALQAGPNGKMGIKLNVKPQYKDKVVNVPYYVNVRVPGKAITTYAAYPVWHYWQFYMLAGLLVLVIFLYLNKVFKKPNNVNVSINDEPKSTANDQQNKTV